MSEVQIRIPDALIDVRNIINSCRRNSFNHRCARFHCGPGLGNPDYIVIICVYIYMYMYVDSWWKSSPAVLLWILLALLASLLVYARSVDMKKASLYSNPIAIDNFHTNFDKLMTKFDLFVFVCFCCCQTYSSVLEL